MTIVFSKLFYVVAYIILISCTLALIEINYRVAVDLGKRKRLRWYQYLDDSSDNIIVWTICFLTCWPGLFIGDLGKETNV